MKSVIGAVAVGASVVMIGASAGAGAAASAPQASRASVVSMPTLKVSAGPHKFKVSGPTKFEAGRVELTLKAKGSESEAELARLHGGYTFKDLRADLTAFGEKQGSGPNGSTPKSAIKHLDRVIKHTTLYGGLDAVSGQTLHATMVLPTAGTYILADDSGNLPSHPHKLTVTGPEIFRPAPTSKATVTATTSRRFGGAKKLPTSGTITFKNKSKESPHFLDLQHVKNGTTRKQVLDYLESGSQQPPPFALNGQVGTDSVGEGLSMTLSYRAVPKGEYIELCFFPDPKTGMPHALMGMIGIVHLK